MKIRQFMTGTAAAALMLGAMVVQVFAATLFSNGFETDTSGWLATTRVASGTSGITSATGSWHAEKTAGSTFTMWGGYNYGAGNAVPTVFHEYKTSIDVYLNVEGPWANNTRFDFTSAMNNSAGTHLSDFIFNAGFYDDATGPGANTDRFVISASYNSQPGSAFAKNPGFDPIAISTTGWYTFQHHFYDNAGVLNVDMSIYDAGGTLIKTWTRVSAPIASVGGNRYGWFDFNEFSVLAFDNTQFNTIVVPTCVFVIAGTTMTLQADCNTDATILVPNGFTLDGNEFTITAVDPAGGHFKGAVIRNGGATAHVTDLTITTSGLADVCDGGNDRLRGILFDGAAGSITNNHVLNINQGASGCQEGNGIEARNEPFTSAGPDLAVLISGNTVANYQKTGIIANGSVAASITGNTITGAGPVSYIAQNGIQVGFGGTGELRDNSVSGNNYTPQDTVACGLLFFQADGVRASKNTLFNNERDQCNFGKGGGTFNPNP
jgi:hypothetical protein